MRTSMQHAGDDAEALVAARIEAEGWTILGRNIHVGRAEIDLLAIDPGPPRMLVVVEVRWRGGRAFGLPEETIDHRKRAHLRAAAWRWLETAPAAARALPIRFDLVVVEPGTAPPDRRIRHHRSAF